MANRSRFKVAAVVGIGVGSAIVLVALAWTALRPPLEIRIKHVGGDPCVTENLLNGTSPVIWQERWTNLLKRKTVRWTVDPSQLNDFIWKFEYDDTGTSEKVSHASGDYLGGGKITCENPQSLTKGPVPDQKKDVDWPYKITVYDCDQQELCSLDPVIWIRR